LSEVDGEEVLVSLPADPQLLRVARLTAANLAGRLGFTFDEVEDVKIAVDELCFALVGSRGREGTLSLRYQLGTDRIAIEGWGTFTDGQAVQTPSELSAQILAATVDEHVVETDGDTQRFRLVKRRDGRP
jgi:hypothetical protein